MSSIPQKPKQSRKRSNTSERQLLRGIMMIKRADQSILEKLFSQTRQNIEVITKEDLHDE